MKQSSEQAPRSRYENYEALLSEDEFERTVAPFLRGMRDIPDEFFVASFDGAGEEIPEGVQFIQSTRDKGLWDVEIGFDLAEDDDEAVQIGAPCRLYAVNVDAEETVRLFKSVLCRGQVPDVSGWADITKEVFEKSPTHKGPVGEMGGRN